MSSRGIGSRSGLTALPARRPSYAASITRIAGRGGVGALIAVGLSGRSFYAWIGEDTANRSLPKLVALGLQLRDEAPPDAKVAVVWAGAVPYFSRLYAIDLLGKSDKVIARSKPHNMNPGHNKWNYAHSIGILQPDYIVELWQPTQEDIAYVTKLGYSRQPNGMYVRAAH